mgnify:CR=1 FL=1
MLNKELEQTLNNAFVFAREHRHEFMTVEHLLLALVDCDDTAGRLLKLSAIEEHDVLITQAKKFRSEVE